MVKKSFIKGYMSPIPKDDTVGSLSGDTISTNKTLKLQEKFKGKVSDKPVIYPAGIGAEHPFDYSITEEVYAKVGLVNGIVNKYVDAIVGEFHIEVEDPNAQIIIDDFIKNNNFGTVVKEWVREGILKGSGYIEIDKEESKIRVLNANDMFIKRSDTGELESYNQYKPKSGVSAIASKDDVENFLPNEIAYLPINRIPGQPYGLGIIWPNSTVIDNICSGEKDYHKLIKRKAGAPYHVQAGTPGEATDSAIVDAIRANLVYQNNRTEWVTDGNVKITSLDFPGLGDSGMKALEHDVQMLSFGTEIPMVLFGVANVNQGIAAEQGEGWQRKIASIQDQAETILEEQLFRPLLLGNSLDVDIKFTWNLPGEAEINERILKITTLLANMSLSPVLRAGLEKEIAKLLDLDDLVEELVEPADAEQAAMDKADAEAEREANIKQPEMPGAKKAANKQLLESLDKGDISIQEWVNLQEGVNIKYSDYLIRILRRLSKDEFTDLKAVTEQDLKDGLLSESDLDKLRVILRDGFRKNKSIREIENDIKNTIDLKDRIVEDRTVLTADSRPSVIARTETVRLANMGLVDLYKENKVEKVKFLAAVSSRTCSICEELNGNVYQINELQVGSNQPPIHANCRCSLVGITS